MNKRFLRGLIWLGMVLGGGQLFQVSFTTSDNAFQSCQQLAIEGAVTPIDFCYILDCQGGFLGGAIQPCGDPTTTADDIFVDCPGGATTDDTNNP